MINDDYTITNDDYTIINCCCLKGLNNLIEKKINVHLIIAVILNI